MIGRIRDCSMRAMLAAVLATSVPACAHRPASSAGEESILKIDVLPEDGDADLFINGNYVGTVAETQQSAALPIRLAVGSHRIELRKPGRFPVQRTVIVERGGAPSVVHATFPEEPPL